MNVLCRGGFTNEQVLFDSDNVINKIKEVLSK